MQPNFLQTYANPLFLIHWWKPDLLGSSSLWKRHEVKGLLSHWGRCVRESVSISPVHLLPKCVVTSFCLYVIPPFLIHFHLKYLCWPVLTFLWTLETEMPLVALFFKALCNVATKLWEGQAQYPARERDKTVKGQGELHKEITPFLCVLPHLFYMEFLLHLLTGKIRKSISATDTAVWQTRTCVYRRVTMWWKAARL